VPTPASFSLMNHGTTQTRGTFLCGEFTAVKVVLPCMEKACQAAQLASRHLVEYLRGQ